MEETLTPVWYIPTLVALPGRFGMVCSGTAVVLALGQWGRRAHSPPLYFGCAPPDPPGLESASECQR